MKASIYLNFGGSLAEMQVSIVVRERALQAKGPASILG